MAAKDVDEVPLVNVRSQEAALEDVDELEVPVVSISSEELAIEDISDKGMLGISPQAMHVHITYYVIPSK
jgi:hypothetical protein